MRRASVFTGPCRQGRAPGFGQGAAHGPGLRRWRVFGLCAALFVCSQFFRVSNAIIASDLQQDLGLSAEALGMLGAAFFYSFAAAQLPVGLCLDRLGARWTMTGLTLVGAAGSVVFALAENAGSAVLGRLLLGLGMAGNLVGPMKLFTQWFPPARFATLSGLLMGLGSVGNMLAATPLALLVGAVGWRWGFVFIGGATGALALLFFALVREAGPTQGDAARVKDPSASMAQRARRLWGSRDYWIISLGTFFRYGTFVAIQGLWIGPFLMGVGGLSPVGAGNLILIMNVGVVLGFPLSGVLSDRVFFSRKRVVLLGLALMALSQLALALGAVGRHAVVSAGILFMLGLSSGFGMVMYAHIKERMPPEMAGLAISGVNLFTMLGGAAFLQGMGWVLDQHAAGGALGSDGFQAAFLMGFAGVVGALCLYLFTREQRGLGRTLP
jgi:predicted MFS family arabinose efflux permease